MSSNFIPTSDAKFNDWQGNLITKLQLGAKKWGIPTAQMTELENLKKEFEIRYTTADNPATRTRAAVTMKNETRKTYESAIRSLLKAYVTYNPTVSDEDRINMGLPIHKTSRTPVSVPATYPEYTVETSLRQIIIHFRDAGKERKAKPTGVGGALIRWDILDTPPTKAVELLNSVLDTASPYTLRFTENQRGSRVYFALAWQNTKGEVGPWSEIGMAIVP